MCVRPLLPDEKFGKVLCREYINGSKTQIRPARFIIATMSGAHAHGKDRALAKQVPRTT